MIGDVYMFGQDCGIILQETESQVFFEISDSYGNHLESRWVDRSRLRNLYFLRNVGTQKPKLRLV
jgi:hypothetical protein